VPAQEEGDEEARLTLEPRVEETRNVARATSGRLIVVLGKRTRPPSSVRVNATRRL